MGVDREYLIQVANRWVENEDVFDRSHHEWTPAPREAARLASEFLTLLTELEQAELDRDHGQRLLEVERHDRQAAESRLAKVPALEEALKEVRDMEPNAIAVINGGLAKRIRKALADYESGQP